LLIINHHECYITGSEGHLDIYAVIVFHTVRCSVHVVKQYYLAFIWRLCGFWRYNVQLLFCSSKEGCVVTLL